MPPHVPLKSQTRVPRLTYPVLLTAPGLGRSSIFLSGLTEEWIIT
jgi:hypothetical protein